MPLFGERQPKRRCRIDARRLGAVHRIQLAVKIVRRRPLVEHLQQPVQLEVGQLAQVAQRTRELQGAVADAGHASDDAHADRAQRVEVDVAPVGIAGNLERRQVARPVEVLHVVVQLVIHARGVHPPQDVAASIGARRADMLADGQRDVAARAPDLVCELCARGGRAHDQHAAVGKVGRSPIPGGRDLQKASGQRTGKRWHLRHVERAGGDHHRAALPRRRRRTPPRNRRRSRAPPSPGSCGAAAARRGARTRPGTRSSRRIVRKASGRSPS